MKKLNLKELRKLSGGDEAYYGSKLASRQWLQDGLSNLRSQWPIPCCDRLYCNSGMCTGGH